MVLSFFMFSTYNVVVCHAVFRPTAEDQRNHVSIPGRGKRSIPSVHTVSGYHPVLWT